jgi:hypothetical protein
LKTIETTTTISQTQNIFGQSVKTFYKANTTDENAEILYFYLNTENWNGLSCATDLAQSGTFFEAIPTFSYAPIGIETYKEDFSTITVNGSTQDIYFDTVTVVSTESFFVNTFNKIIPEETESYEEYILTTFATSSQNQILTSNSIILGHFGGTAIQAATSTTRQIVCNTIVTKRKFLNNSSYRQSYITQSTIITTEQFYFQANSNTETSSTSSYSVADDSFFPNFSATRSFFTSATGRVSLSFIGSSNKQTPPQNKIKIEGAAGIVKIYNSGAKIGNNEGLFFISPISFQVPSYAFDGDNTKFRTLLPVTNSDCTINSNSVTISGNPTTSFTVGVAGQKQLEASGATLNIGGYVKNFTAIENINYGIYKNVLNGQTLSFDGNDSSYNNVNINSSKKLIPIHGVFPPNFPESTKLIPTVFAVKKFENNTSFIN